MIISIKIMKTQIRFLMIVFFSIVANTVLYAQKQQTIAVLSIDAAKVELEAVTVADLVRLELDKTGVFNLHHSPGQRGRRRSRNSLR